MPEPRLHETLLADRIIEIIDQALSTELGLKVVTMGSLMYYPAQQQLETNAPAIFVKPAPTTNLERITTGQTYKITYEFRVVFVHVFGANEEVVREKTFRTQKIAELFIDNFDLGGFTIPNGQILRATCRQIEWEPPEDNFVNSLRADMTASALNLTVETSSRL